MEKMILKKKMHDEPDDEVLGLQIVQQFLEETMDKNKGTWKVRSPYRGQDLEEVKSTIKSEIETDSDLSKSAIDLKKAGEKLEVVIEFEYAPGESDEEDFQDPYIETWHELAQ